MNGLLLGICAVVFSLTAMAAEKGLVTKPSQYSVPETLDRWRPSSDRWAFTSLLGSISRLWQEMLAHALRPHQLLIWVCRKFPC